MSGAAGRTRGPDDNSAGGWTGAVQRRALRALPPDKLLPTTQPEYVASWIYVFGVLTLSSLVVVITTGCVLALFGPAWWHVSGVGRYINSLHLWSVELFMFVMVVHLWGKFFMAAWRGRRTLTWITGAVVFIASIGAAFTGYLVQQNFDSQWIAGQAKDGLNSVGIGAWFNVLDFGQMFMWHIVLLPMAVAVLAVWHMLLVRLRGVVPPIGTTTPEPVPDRSREPA
ncbi:cytochrome b N-terminal domain-containing protein [Streptomyces sp. NBC_00057]|uniref:cytochrome b N-terminal domain-containing protein n=1 Tax=Streptomyces sp. NBC_00057 TaxID=2975634 RepID=UPI00324664B3